MRRFSFTLTVLALLGVAVFMIGWIPLRLRPGSYAVLVTKTGGVDPKVVAPGHYRWAAEALLPTNLVLRRFSPAAAERRLEASGELPSAEVYGAFMAGEPDFSYSLVASLIAAPKPEALPELYERWGVTDDEALAAWLASELDLATADLRAAIQEALRSGSSSPLGGVDERALALALSQSHPLLDLRGVRIVSSRMPDARLYEEARRLYALYLETYRAAVEPALAESSAGAAVENVRLERLERYGELLERFPALIDYLAIEAGIAPRPTAGK
ncbi:MAG TPA: hypothetical protein PLE25_12270 [Spirochaetales bacterium]|nr:hypothetical protein [Spirochaetales bacterium]